MNGAQNIGLIYYDTPPQYTDYSFKKVSAGGFTSVVDVKGKGHLPCPQDR